MKGEVIGINNSIASNGGGNEGVGFSIPINLARWIMNELIAHGRVTRGALGVDLHPEFRQEDAVALGMERPRGAWIDTVHHASPAAKAGLRDGDVVLRFAGRRDHRPESPDQHGLDGRRRESPPRWSSGATAASISLHGDRGRARSHAHAAVAAAPEPGRDPSGLLRRPNRPGAGSSYVLGLELATLNPELARRIEMPETWRGALVLTVDARARWPGGCSHNDVISAIDNQVIQSAEQAVKILNQRADHVQLVDRAWTG